MSEIPFDIETAVDILLDEAWDGDQYNFLRDRIERAIIAERVRCIALCRRAGSPEWSDDTNSGYELAARETAEDIEKGR